MAEIGPGPLANLAFWSRNMVLIRDGGMEWPGFSYAEAEWARMDALADAAEGRFGIYITVNTVLFLCLAAAVMAGVFLPLAILLFPVPAETPALSFVLLLTVCVFVVLGAGLPLTMAASARIAANGAMRAKLIAAPGDAALAAKVRWQLLRITIIMCGLLVPGIMLWITYDIKGGPIITALKWASIGLMAASMAAGAARRRSRT